MFLGAKNPCIFVFMRDTGRFAYVYIMANDWRVLDVGVTSTLEQRVQQHKEEDLYIRSPRAITCTSSFTSNAFQPSLLPLRARSRSRAGVEYER
jgi:hypothetical protein